MKKRDKAKILYKIFICSYPILPLLVHLFPNKIPSSFLYISTFGYRLYTYISVLLLDIAMLIGIIFDFGADGILSNSSRKTRVIAHLVIAIVLSIGLFFVEY